MGGARNGRILRLLVGIVVVVFILYMFYLYHTTKGELEETHKRLTTVSKIHERLTKELKDSIQNHAQLAGELKDERNSHFKTVSEKDRMQQRCTEDIGNLRKTCENEKSLLTDQKNALLDERDRLTTARDEFQAQALKHQTGLTDLQHRHQTLTDNCNQQSETARRSIQQTQERVKQLEGELTTARSSLQDAQQRHLQCRTELDQTRQRVTSLDVESRNKQGQIQVLEQQARDMHNRITSLEDDNQKLEHRLKQSTLEQAPKYQPQQPDARDGPGAAYKYQPQQPDARNVPGAAYARQPQPGVVQSQELRGEVRREAPSDRPAGLDDVKVTDQQKERIFRNLHEKLINGEVLTEKQSQIYQLLLKQARNNLGGNVDQGMQQHAPQEQLPPDPNGRNQQQPENFPRSQQQAGLISDKPAFPAKPPQPPPPPPPPGGQRPDGFGVRQPQPDGFGVRQQQPDGFGVRQQPDGFGARQQPDGFGARQPDGFGVRQQPDGFGARQPDGFGMRQQQPDGFGVRQQPDGFGMRQQPDGFGMRQPQPDGFGARQQPDLGLRQPPGGMQPQQGHNEQRSPEEQEEVQDIADPGKEGGQQFDNLGDEKQQKFKTEDEEVEGGAQRGFDTGEIVKQAGKDTNAAKPGENDNPLPQPADENQNPDKGFDDYGNNKDEDEEEEYEYEEDRYGDRQLGKDMKEQQRNMNMKNLEHQLQQPALRERDTRRMSKQQNQRLNEMR